MKYTKSAPAFVASLLGKNLNKIHVLKFNEKKSKPRKPVVDYKCFPSAEAVQKVLSARGVTSRAVENQRFSKLNQVEMAFRPTVWTASEPTPW